jgi:outer membrane lipoprotein-sorting protein
VLLAIVSVGYSKSSVADRVQAFLNGITSMVASFDQVDTIGRVADTAKFYLLRNGGDLLIKIDYCSGLDQVILVHNDHVSVFNKKAKKKHMFHISQTPIYAVLSGKLDLSKEKHEILEDSNELIRMKLIGSSAFSRVDVTLIFSKYPKTGNIQKLIAWVIDDGKSETLVSFDQESIHINDKISNDVFNPPF